MPSRAFQITNLSAARMVRHEGPAAPLPTDLSYRKKILWL